MSVVENIKAVTDEADPIGKGWRIDPRGLQVSRALSFQEWRKLGEHLAMLATGAAWAVGDWLIYGEGCGEYGRSYEEAAAVFERSFDTLSKYARVSREFPREQRIAGLSWSHYRNSLPLPTADRIPALKLADSNNWTCNALEVYVRSRSVEAVARYAGAEEGHTGRREGLKKWRKWNNAHHQPKSLKVQCPQCHHAFRVNRKGESAKPTLQTSERP